MTEIFLSILPIFLITMLGSGIRRYWLTSDEFWSGLEKLSYFLLFPAVLFNYISTAELGSGASIKLVFGLILATLIVGCGLVIHQKHRPISPAEFTSIFQGALRYNSYIFFACGSALYGEEGLAIVAVISAYMIIFTNVISVLAFNSYVETENMEHGLEAFQTFLKKFTTNPLIISSVAGFIFNYAGLEMNIGIQKTLLSLGDAALAIGLLNVGCGLKFTFSSTYVNRMAFTGIVKLCLLPAVTAITLSLFAIGGTHKAIGILYSGLPCASTAYILSKQLGGDADLMASIITVTTVISVFSLSIIMYLMA